MLGRWARAQGELLIVGSLRELIPNRHALERHCRVAAAFVRIAVSRIMLGPLTVKLPA